MDKPNLTENLKSWDYINRYSKWMFNTYKQHLGKRILDIGTGVGNMVKFIIEDAEFVMATDIFNNQLELVNERFSEYRHKLRTMKLDIEKDVIDEIKPYAFDTIICINVLEHIEDDAKALIKMKDILIGGGKIILIVPAFQKLYNYMDKNAGHYRRYNRGEVRRIAQETSMTVIKDIYFNMLGIIPYHAKGKSTRYRRREGTFSSTLNEQNSKIYNAAASILEPIEKVLRVPFGLSEVLILQKP